MKSTILLTTALFLASAPSPDAKTISEFSAGFLAVKHDYKLLASEPEFQSRADMYAAANPTGPLRHTDDKVKNRNDG